MIDNKPVLWSDIKEGITGYVRMIRYTNHSLPNEIDLNKQDVATKLINLKPENLEIETVEEGSFKKGFKDGYCRVMQARDGSCEVGFFQMNIPMGKYCMYKSDGTYLLQEGLYEGQGQCKSKIEIANYMMQTAVRKQRTNPRKDAIDDQEEESPSNFQHLDDQVNGDDAEGDAGADAGA